LTNTKFYTYITTFPIKIQTLRSGMAVRRNGVTARSRRRTILAMIDDPSAEEAKELYAHFGLTFYCSNVFEHGVANAIFIFELMVKRREVKTREEWEILVDTLLRKPSVD